MKRALLSLISAPLAFTAVTVASPAMAATGMSAPVIQTSSDSQAAFRTGAFDDDNVYNQRRYRRGDYYNGRGRDRYDDDDRYDRRDRHDSHDRYEHRDRYDSHDRYDRSDRYDRRDRYDDRRYRDQRVNYNTRIWRDRRDGRYYCQRDDGTTGLLIGGAVGGVIGNEIAGRGDKLLGTILGAAGGAILGRSLDRKRDDYRCR